METAMEKGDDELLEESLRRLRAKPPYNPWWDMVILVTIAGTVALGLAYLLLFFISVITSAVGPSL
jgi:hypothetical protein